MFQNSDDKELLTVIVADDNSASLDLLYRLISKITPNIFKARDGNEAIELIKTHKSSIDLALLDIEMPLASGVDVAKTIKKMNIDIDIVFMIGTDSLETIKEAISLGALSFIFKPIRMKTILDITNNALDKKTTRRKKDLLQSRFGLLWELASMSNIISMTDSKGNITYVNEAFCEISGYDESELIGKPHSIFRHPDNSSALFETLWGKISQGETWRDIIKNRAKDGSNYWVDTLITPITTLNSAPSGYISMRHDVTESHRLKRKLEDQIGEEKAKSKKQGDMLQRSSRMALMGDMLSMIAHQWRQPLSSISALSANLRMDYLMGEKIDSNKHIETFAQIEELVDHLSKTIEDFRDFFKPDKTKVSIELETLVNSSIKMLEAPIKNHSIQINIESPNRFLLKIYSRELIQVLINLIKNSIDVVIDNKIKNPIINIKIIRSRERAILSIEDNGGGIPKELLPDKLFEPYVSTKGNVGTGLGLYMSKIIIETHCEGELKALNTEIGAKFIIDLPILAVE